MKLILNKDRYIIIEKDLSESEEIFSKRCNYILSHSFNNSTELKNIINKSRLWRNINYYNMNYDIKEL